MEVPDPVVDILKAFSNAMLLELPKTLLPRNAVDHEIELELGTKPPTKALYWTAIRIGRIKKTIGGVAGCWVCPTLQSSL